VSLERTDGVQLFNVLRYIVLHYDRVLFETPFTVSYNP